MGKRSGFSERVRDQKKVCARKVTYLSKADAKRAAKNFRKRLGTRQYVYHCPWCREFHLTRQKQHWHGAPVERR